MNSNNQKILLPDKYSDGVVQLSKAQLEERLRCLAELKKLKRDRFLAVMSQYIEVKWT